MQRLTRLILALGALIGAAAAQSAPIGTDATLQPFTIADQNGATATVDQDVRVILFSRDMTANKLAKQAFMDKPADYLPAAHAMYLIDVSGMPRFVTNTFAIPKMQKYGYRIFLDREGNLTTDLPAREKQVTVLTVDRLKVTGIAYVSDAAALTRAVEAAAQ